jgi:hypothetical protein
MNAGEKLPLSRTVVSRTGTPPTSSLLLLTSTAGQKEESRQEESPKSRDTLDVEGYLAPSSLAPTSDAREEQKLATAW